jgi:protein subunit release factor A
MGRIAEEEAEAAAAQKKTLSSQITESKIPADNDDDYNNLIN